MTADAAVRPPLSAEARGLVEAFAAALPWERPADVRGLSLALLADELDAAGSPS